jgi:hypothetical protein
MTNIYRVVAPHRSPEYCPNRQSVDQRAQTVADEAGEVAIIERCKLVDLSTASLAVAILNDGDWCAEHHILRYVKPKRQQQQQRAA